MNKLLGHCRAGVIVICLATLSIPALSQIDNPAAQQQQRNEENLRRKEIQERMLNAPGFTSPLEILPPTEQNIPLNNNLSFYLTTLNFSESSWLTKSELDSIKAKYEGQQVTFTDLKALIDGVNALYRSKGIITAKAVLPAQKIVEGEVSILLVEGRVGAISLDGNSSTHDSYILNRLAISENELIDTKKLEQELIKFNRMQDIRIKAQLEKGDSFGLTNLLLNVQEPKKHEFEAYANNTGTDETGNYRFGFSYFNNSLMGIRDKFGLSLLGSTGDKGIVLAYDMPISFSGDRLSFNFIKDDLDINSEAFADLDIEATSTNAAIEYSRPLKVDAKKQLNVVAGYELRTADTHLDGFLVQESEVNSIPIGIDYEHFDSASAFYSRLRYTIGGEKLFDKRHFSKLNLSTTYIYRKNQDVNIIVNFSGQKTSSANLPSGQGFQIGGATTVRGYNEGLISGDEGAFINLEIHHNISTPALDADPNKSLALMLFADRGYSRPHKSSDYPEESNLLGSIGLGFQFNYARSLLASIVVGIPVVTDDSIEDRWRAHFNLVYRL